MSLARHNFSAKAEAALNSHINVEFNASYIYASLGTLESNIFYSKTTENYYFRTYINVSC